VGGVGSVGVGLGEGAGAGAGAGGGIEAMAGFLSVVSRGSNSSTRRQGEWAIASAHDPGSLSVSIITAPARFCRPREYPRSPWRAV